MPASLPILEIDASEVSDHADAIDRILRRELFGMVVRNAFDPDGLAEAVRRLERGSGLPLFESHTFRGRTYGRVLRMAGEDMDTYFEAARSTSAALAELSDVLGYEARISELLGALGGRRPVRVPSAGERRYAPASVRVLDPGGTVDLHCGNETHRFPCLRELSQMIDATGEISTLLPLSLPEEGGELEVYDVCFGDPLIRELDTRLGRERAHTALQDRCALRLRPAVGDLALFEEGRHYHRVSEVRGTRARWTMGGFTAPSRDGQVLYYWS